MNGSSEIQLYSGIVFDPLKPDLDKLDIGDIAHALSMQCRFGGHVREFYSVAQHSAHVAFHVPAEHALSALLHDASEAYLVDIPKPLKQDLFGERYREVENSLMTAIALRFGVSWPLPPEVKEADERMLATEYRDLMPHNYSAEQERVWAPWINSLVPYEEELLSLPPVAAEVIFLKSFELYGGKQ